MNKKLLWAAMFSAVALAGCNGKDGAQGPQGPEGPEGPEGPGTNPPVAETFEVVNAQFANLELGDNQLSVEFELTNENDHVITQLKRVRAYVARVQDGGLGASHNGGYGYVNGDDTTEGASLEQTEDGMYKFTTPIALSDSQDPQIIVRLGGGTDGIPSQRPLVLRTSFHRNAL
ncbi:hypothetical protein [Paraferrimonas haliotis]|uniref:Collagen-like protein n=1 Tax=Paraferrimonas haliotis TaxID=2013866 RepID=A0AA37TNK9_9GAMM|nr:hypothetical protein [Paraferrimonas haliotis]GLS85004.1 hypothetical protein GCM10007894_29810 [Paraferrimonas haliotis]